MRVPLVLPHDAIAIPLLSLKIQDPGLDAIVYSLTSVGRANRALTDQPLGCSVDHRGQSQKCVSVAGG